MSEFGGEFRGESNILRVYIIKCFPGQAKQEVH